MATHKVEFPTHSRPSTEVGVIKPIAIGLGLTVVLFALLYFGAKGSFLRDLFMGRDKIFADRLLFQGLITLVFFMSLATAFLKAARIKAEKAIIDQDPIPDDLEFRSNSDNVIATYEKVRSHPKLTDSLARKVCARWDEAVVILKA